MKKKTKQKARNYEMFVILNLLFFSSDL